MNDRCQPRFSVSERWSLVHLQVVVGVHLLCTLGSLPGDVLLCGGVVLQVLGSETTRGARSGAVHDFAADALSAWARGGGHAGRLSLWYPKKNQGGKHVFLRSVRDLKRFLNVTILETTPIQSFC